ncbi:O-antigen/teichoic acid export membrane protein [Granulicella arctica]|uniref:O-antigen/teichoic acid export membrane protein n=2 Tax=Granulicella arctica TaxID=940613 RepID=A0A7Y9PJ11_9BACT|nr:O-antigen/teichoic acid export membrane protein [Granulicella arctica]
MATANLLGRGLGYISIILMARRLAVPYMGAYALLYTASMLVELIANLGLDKLLMREIAGSSSAVGKGYFRAALPIRFAMATVSWAAAWGLLMRFFRHELPVSAATAGIFLAMIFPVIATRNCEAFLTAHEKLIPIAFSQFAERMLMFAAAMLLVTDKLSFGSMMCVAPLAALVRMIMIAVSTRKEWMPNEAPVHPNVRKLVREGLELFLTEVLALVYFRSDVFVMAKMRGLADTGIYQIAYKIFDVCLSLFAGFLQAAFPRMARNNTKEMLRTHLLTGSLLLSVPAIGVILLRHPILDVFHKQYVTGSTALVWLMLTVPLVYINSTLANATIVARRVRLLGAIALLLVVMNVSLDIALIPRWGINAAAFVTFFCEVFSTVVLAPLLLRTMTKVRDTA